MSKDKELSADVKTVLHGEVLGPEEDEEIAKKEALRKKIRDKIAADKERKTADEEMWDSYRRQDAWYREQMRNQQQYSPFQNQYMGNMMGGQVGGLFNASVFDFLFRRK